MRGAAGRALLQVFVRSRSAVLPSLMSDFHGLRPERSKLCTSISLLCAPQI